MEQRDFAESLAAAHHAKRSRLTLADCDLHGEMPAGDQMHGVAIVSLVEDDLAPGEHMSTPGVKDKLHLGHREFAQQHRSPGRTLPRVPAPRWHPDVLLGFARRVTKLTHSVAQQLLPPAVSTL